MVSLQVRGTRLVNERGDTLLVEISKLFFVYLIVASRL